MLAVTDFCYTCDQRLAFFTMNMRSDMGVTTLLRFINCTVDLPLCIFCCAFASTRNSSIHLDRLSFVVLLSDLFYFAIRDMHNYKRSFVLTYSRIETRNFFGSSTINKRGDY